MAEQFADAYMDVRGEKCQEPVFEVAMPTAAWVKRDASFLLPLHWRGDIISTDRIRGGIQRHRKILKIQRE